MNSVSKDYSGDLAGMLFGVSEPLNFESRISDRERQVENTNLHCLSCTMYMPWLRICGLTNIFIPVPAKIRTVSGRVEGGRSVRSLTHVSRFPQGPVKVLYGRERPSLAGADLVSIVKKHRRSEQSRSVHPVSQPVHVVTRERVSPISTNQRAVRHCVLFEVVS